MNVEKFVKANPTMIKEVTNPIFLDRSKAPTVDGLLSTEIFGNTTKERQRKFGYISLGGYYFQPVIFKNIKRLDRKIERIVAGKLKVVINKDGSLSEDTEHGYTGIDFLYKNWEKLKWKKNESRDHNDRVDILTSHTKAEIFTNVWLVCPAMYRDINLQDIDTRKMSSDTVNGLYSKLIRYTSMLKQDSSFTTIMHNTKYMIQSTLVEIYDYFKNSIEKKNGLIRKSLLSKNIDYGARLVITSPNYNYNSYRETDVDFFHAGLPLANCCSVFTPFILGWVRNFLQREFELIGNKFPVYVDNTKDNKINSEINNMYDIDIGSFTIDAESIIKRKLEFIPLKDPMSYYNDEKIRKMMETFIFSYSGRFDPIEIPHENMEKDKIYATFKGKNRTTENFEDSPISNRYFTLTDLFYLAACDVCSDKHIYITRYPMTDTLGTFQIKINVLSTHKTQKIELEGKVYDHYPVINLDLPKDEVASQFIDTLRFPNVFLKAMNGDYDGDQVTVKGVFSQSANLEADKIMHSKFYVLNMAGENIRVSHHETIQTLYDMTRFKD
jgi:DNA-directed RNA polymerase beta' subunit